MSETQAVVAEKPKAKIMSVRGKDAGHKAKQSHFGLSEFKYARFTHTMPVGWDFRECLRPEYWVNVCYLLQKNPRSNEPDKAGAIIEVRTEDHEWYAELYVRAVQAQGLVVSVLRAPERVAPVEKANGTGPYEKRWNVGKGGYDVIRTLDGAFVGDGKQLKTKEAAQDFIDKMQAV